ncbi:hypothetical protein G7Y89_g9710 [Cudoniella acicularis]|uniref:Uncharacterized protein n=1 Tax=Cudoniella acicularis TaxID=354080 RepID=A0A8H4RE53_9HELO|nr:hypothetical protein G7Y89_g9710 [Cudoniella acicularis]
MSILVYMMSKPHWASHTQHPEKERKRLHKKPRCKTKKSLYACKDIIDVVQEPTCLTLLTDDGHSITGHGKGEKVPHIAYLLKDLPPLPSEYTLSHYSKDTMGSMRTRRSKTPVYFVGQLESKRRPYDTAQVLADQYQASLPNRPFTPADHDLAKSSHKCLRKIKCQQSLRDMIKEHSKSLSYSDCDTLVGSDVSDSPTSPTRKFPEINKFHLVDKIPRQAPVSEELANMDPGIEHDIGLQICMNLLTNELASALFRQHPTEKEDRASGLQILLMIEAYEAMQQQIRRELYNSHVTGHGMDSHVRYVDGILDHWLDALYAVYDRSQLKKNHYAPIKEVEEEEWPPRRSEDSQATCVN